LQLIRNHAEAVVEDKGVDDLVNMVGFNFRMTEIEAAIASEQLKKLERLIADRVRAADQVTEGLTGIRGLTAPMVQPGIRHSYYVYALRYDSTATGVPRERFAQAVAAEGVPIREGYAKPLYLQPLYQRRIAFGRDGFPFTYPGYSGSADYRRGLCPVTERMYEEELLYTTVCHGGASMADMEDVVAAFQKVVEHAAALR
jgi:dTDP-4-amino-4,6-dideoxygalactose transaminase